MSSSSSFSLIPVISSVMHALVGFTYGVYNGTGPSNGTIHARERYYTHVSSLTLHSFQDQDKRDSLTWLAYIAWRDSL
jgi:hypothetical protein